MEPPGTAGRRERVVPQAVRRQYRMMGRCPSMPRRRREDAAPVCAAPSMHRLVPMHRVEPALVTRRQRPGRFARRPECCGQGGGGFDIAIARVCDPGGVSWPRDAPGCSKPKVISDNIDGI